MRKNDNGWTGLEHELGQLKLALGNSDRKFDKLENRFDELIR